MGKRGPIVFGMLLSLSFFSGLLTLMLLSGTTSPIPPASELPRLLPPEAEAPDVVGSPRASSPLQIPFPVLDDGGVVVPGATTLGSLVAGIPSGGTGTSPRAGDGSEPGPIVVQPPGVLPREDPDEDPDTDRHARARGKGHDKGHGKGHDRDHDHDRDEDSSGRSVTSHGDDASSGKSRSPGKTTKSGGGGKASKRLAKR